MLKNLSQGIKISITRSISTVFEQYMASIEWSEKRYDIQEFMKEWQAYINNQASWFDKVDEKTKSSTAFHEELALKINETIQKILTEDPTEEQVNTITALEKELGEDVEYSCKAEARFVIDQLEAKVKKKSN